MSDTHKRSINLIHDVSRISLKRDVKITTRTSGLVTHEGVSAGSSRLVESPSSETGRFRGDETMQQV
ncbi:MAG: hypothetical protein O2856_18135 [Planctomycetota bacterium]|nr:hypothetical protein [Planctomycetota bacterium]